MSEREELKPCPFCGGEGKLYDDYSSERDEHRWQVWHVCDKGPEGESAGYGNARYTSIDTPWFKSREKAVEAWNTRTPEQAIAAMLGVVDKGEPQGADGNLDRSQIDWLRFMPDGWDGTPPTLGCGKLTAEQVEEIVDRNCEWYEGGEIDAQAIADELNVMLRNGTCHDKNGFDESIGFECTSCETTVDSYMQTTTSDKPEQFRYCPNCGKEVK